MELIEVGERGFMVYFEWHGDGFLRSDYFPDKHGGEEVVLLVETEQEAWEYAAKFAKAMKGKVCNLYVVDKNFHPVKGYKQREIVNR